MRRLALIVPFAVALATFVPAAGATHDADIHSDNMSLVASYNDKGEYTGGTDLAFWGNLAVAGNLSPGGFRVMDVGDPKKPVEVGQFDCMGSQSDVSIWKSLVFVSIDGTRAGPECTAASASPDQFVMGTHWEGVRIVSIEDPANPEQIATVKTDCGSHTHTLVPDLKNKRLLLYVLSYPLGAQVPTCSVPTHRKISVIEVPLDNPKDAKVISTPDVSPAIGCHDVNVFLQEDIAVAGCITESQVWNISDPANPVVTDHIRNPQINIHHSAALSWDGETLVLGDELGGAAFSPGCLTGGQAPTGSVWFYDMADLTAPVGYWTVPQDQAPTGICTAHNYDVVPLKSDRDILVTSWYTGGTHVVDFTDPANPQQIGYYIPKEGGVGVQWSSYWYNGYIYTNDEVRGMDILKLKDPAVKAKNLIKLPRLNPQTQEPLPKAKK